MSILTTTWQQANLDQSIRDSMRIAEHKKLKEENDKLKEEIGQLQRAVEARDSRIADMRRLLDNRAEQIEGLKDNIEDLENALYKQSQHFAEQKKFAKYAIPEDNLVPKRILVNGPATIIFWRNGAKTVVKCAENEPYSLYNAFTASLALRLFGKNTAIKKTIKKLTEIQALPKNPEGLWEYADKEKWEKKK